jgi:hypothetical protein
MANLLINPFGLGSATPKMGHSLGGPQATIAQTAYGAQQSPVGNPGQLQSWHLAVAVPVAAVAWLAFLRWSLPK